MKICLRTNAERGGEQSPRQDCSVNPASSDSPRSPLWRVSSGTPTTKNPADHPLRRGAACCARLSAGDQCHSLDVHFSNGSNRFWPANRSSRKQTIKPGLTGARTAQCRAQFPIAKPRHHNRRPIATGHSPLATVVSNRELQVLGIPQLVENKHRQLSLIENFEPISAPSFRPFATAACLPRAPKASLAAYPYIEIPRRHTDANGAS